MDLMMPNMGGAEAITQLSAICPEIPILVLSSLQSEESIFEAVRAGARGYLTKDVQHDELISAIRLVSVGKSYLPPEIVQKLVGGIRSDLIDAPLHSLTLLTKREKEVLVLLAKGYSNSVISKNMTVQQSTVRVYLHQIMKKMDFENRREMMVFAIEEHGKK
jgi:DNA-binding NarL/FixJ family response regulator